MRRTPLIVMFLSALLLQFLYTSVAQQDYRKEIVIDIDPEGVANVTINLDLDEGLNEIRLPVEPLVITILATSNGKAVPTIYEDNTLHLILDTPSRVKISYIANISITNTVFYLDIKTPDIVQIRIPIDSIILLSWPEENIVNYSYAQGILTLYVIGPITIRYTSKIYATPRPPTNTTAVIESPTPQPTSQPTLQTPTTATPTVQELPWVMLLVIVVLMVGGSGIAIYIFIKRRRGVHKGMLELLSDVDLAIIKALEARGGSALQTEIQEDVKVPRTTLWRHIKKLERLGIVRVEKVGLQNRVILVRKVKT